MDFTTIHLRKSYEKIQQLKMMKKISTLTFVFCAVLMFAQSSNKNLNRDLKSMRDAAINKEYEKMVELIYPKSFDIIGGKANAPMMLRMMDAKAGEEGVKLVSITHKNLGKLVKTQSELQLPLDQITILKAKDGKNISTNLTLIAISNDKGKNWKFINTFNQPKDRLYTMFPNLSKELQIPEKKMEVK